jgi:altronate dehydratase
MSSSVFAELTDSALSAPVTAESLSKAKETMLSEYAELFGQNTKLVNRAVMAASLNKMPVVFNTAQELTDYIQQSLLQCRDEYERKAALNILDSIMLEG